MRVDARLLEEAGLLGVFGGGVEFAVGELRGDAESFAELVDGADEAAGLGVAGDRVAALEDVLWVVGGEGVEAGGELLAVVTQGRAGGEV